MYYLHLFHRKLARPELGQPRRALRRLARDDELVSTASAIVINRLATPRVNVISLIEGPGIARPGAASSTPVFAWVRGFHALF